MATIIKETGVGSTSSNSYVSEADLTAYIGQRGVTLGGANGTPSETLIKSMDYLESKTFRGDKYTRAQALQWPRSNVVLDGYSVGADEIPQLLQDSQMEIAISIDGGVNPLANVGRDTKREKVGDIEVEYMDGARSSDYLTAAETKLEKLTVNYAGVYRV
jgi:Putative DnaT-like ssDNA binding protein